GASAEELAMGCKLANKLDSRAIALDKIASGWRWRAAPPKSSNVSVRVRENKGAGQNDWQAFYLFSGATKDQLRTFADDTQVILNVDLKEDVPGVSYFAQTMRDSKPGSTVKPTTN